MVSTVITMLPAGQHKGFSQEGRARAGLDGLHCRDNVASRSAQGLFAGEAGQGQGWMVSTVITMLPAGQQKGCSQEGRARARQGRKGQGKAARAAWSPLSSQCCQRGNTRAVHRRTGQGQDKGKTRAGAKHKG